MINSDSRTDTITSSEWQKIKKHVEATEDDSLIIVWASDDDIQTAVMKYHSCKRRTIGIPSETRQALGWHKRFREFFRC
jgi:Glu-tRNA(Gln) amidotransferase subunit E-like FAD-binding protein